MASTSEGHGSPAHRPLTPDEWCRLVEVFEAALEQPAGARDAWLEAAEPDAELRDLVRAMLRADNAPERELPEIAELAELTLGTEPSLAQGTRVDDFVIDQELARGGMGVLYRATDVRLERPVALKFFRRPATSQVDRRRQLAEARAVAAIDHPNIATVHRVGESPDGALYFAMPLYEGSNLRERLRLRDGPLSPGETLDVARQVARGLATAHAAGIIHRDVKPENIFLTADGTAKLLDFGVAASARPSLEDESSGGTTAYMSPERLAGASPDPRMDVWAFGVTLLETLTGDNPFFGGDTLAVSARISDSTRRAPRVPLRHRRTRLGRVLQRCLSPDPADRYADGAVLLDALGPRARHPVAVGLAAAATAAALILLVMFPGLIDGNGGGLATERARSPTLLVLPFTGRSADTADAYLSEALSDQVALQLGRARGLRVRSSFRTPAAGREPDVAAMAHAAGAEYVLDGQVHWQRGRRVVAAELTRAADGKVEWRETFSADSRFLPALDTAIASAVTRLFGVPFDSRADREGVGMGRGDPVAYEHYLRGNYYLKRRTPAAVGRAMHEYERALEADGGFVAAVARRAYGAALFLDWGWEYPGRSADELLAEVTAMIETALAADSLLADAWLARAYLTVLRNPNGLDRSLQDFRRALALDPRSAEAHHQYGQTLMSLGRYEEAVTAYRNALDLEPDRAMTIMPVGAIRARQGRMREAMTWFDSAVAIAPEVPYPWAVRAVERLQAGEAAGALADADRALALDDSYATPALAARALALQRLGREAEARAELERIMASLVAPSAPSPTDALFVGLALVAMDRQGEFLDLLESVRPRGRTLWFYLDRPGFDSLRGNPRFDGVASEAWPDSSRPMPGPSRMI